MSKYFPSLEIINRGLGIDLSKVNRTARVEVSSEFLLALIKKSVQAAPFSAEDYLKLNADLSEAWQQGEITDLHKHFVEHGYFEGRRAYRFQVDKDWYLKTNRDVALAVRDGDVQSAAEHFALAGEREWRAPNEETAEAVYEWREIIFGLQQGMSLKR